jgi:hypothetical protein
MLENIWLIGTHYPEWKVYIYAAPDVEEGFINQVSMYSNVVIKPTEKLGRINMVERFYAIDDPDVDIMFVRDADSHVHWKDRWAINDFLLKPNYIAHIIRDNPSHNVHMLGGLWGIRKVPNISIRELFKLYEANPIDYGIEQDQNFLCAYLFPLIWKSSLVHYSHDYLLAKWEKGVRFPFQYTNDVYCGRTDGDNGKFYDYPEPNSVPKVTPVKIDIGKVFTALKSNK